MRNSIPDRDNFGVGLETVKLPERLARSYRNYKKQFKPKQGKLSVDYSVFSEVKDKSDTENTDYVFGSLIDPL